MIDGANGLLPIIVFDSDHNWNDMRKLAEPHLDEAGQHRLETALKMTVKAVAVERHYIDKDYRDTFSNFHSKKFNTPDSRCIRLHFFAESISRADVRDAGKLQKHYIGYSIIRPTRPNAVGRTLLDPNRLHYVNGTMCVCEERPSVQGVELKVKGFPFISQDADVTVCAQSALWMLLRYFSNKYPVYREMYPFQIAQLTKDYSIGRIVPSGGLTNWQMSEVTRQLGFSPLIYSRDDHKEIFDHLLYTYIESGIPILAFVPGHVVVAFGHCSDYKKSLPPGSEPMFTSHFNTSYVINDDNGVPYQLLRDGEHGLATASRLAVTDVWGFTVPLPEKVYLPAEHFQVRVKHLLFETEFGIKHCSPPLEKERLVLRLFLTSNHAFKRHLDRRGMGHDTARDVYANMPLPHFIWVCEISTAAAFAEHQILGEVIWDATRNAFEFGGWIALHYPEVLLVDQGAALNAVEHAVKRFDLKNFQKYPLFRSNLKEVWHPI